MRKFSWLLALTLAVIALPFAAEAQQRGSVTGRVVDASSNQPLSEVQVLIQGTTRGTLTNSQGTYRIDDVPTGPVEVRVTRIGYQQASQAVTITAGGVATANFTLAPSAVELGAVIVTATGQRQAKRELGNTVGTINVEESVPMASVTNTSDVLMGRSPGVSVLNPGGTTGTGARIRIRGSNSMSLSNDPLMIIDGARVDNSSGGIAVGGQTTSRFDDLNPEDIESIEILKGPAASALYGTAAANGVIVVTTKSGRAGPTRFRAYTEQGTIEQYVDFPANWDAVTASGAWCLRARGQECAEITNFNPHTDPRSTPYEDGRTQTYGISASGGNDQTTFFLSADYLDEQGPYKFNANWMERVNLRANIAGQLAESLDFSVASGYTNSDLRLPQNDNNTLGLLSGGMLGYPAFNETTCGMIAQCPEALAAIDTRQQVERINGSATMNWSPIPWLSVVGTAGLDRVNRFDNETIPPGRVSFGSLPEGYRESNRVQLSNYTANLSATANYDVIENVTGSTAIGGQFHEEILRGTYANGAQLLPGTGSLAGTNARFNVNESNTQIRTIGAFLEQRLVFRDRIYLAGSVRADDNSAFGQDFGLVYYPSFSASWVIAEEPWFPQTDALSTFRLRGAVGTSGLRPGQNSAITYLSPVAVRVENASVPGFIFGGTGNPNLKPEKSREYEFGFDAGFLEDRFGLELTYYNKKSTNALVSRRLPPSLGLTTSRFENLGEVSNQGLEVLLNTLLLDLPDVRWNLTTSASWNKNRLEDLGTDPITGEPIPEIIFGLGTNSQRHAEGLPLGGYYGEGYTYEDANGDGIIQTTEVTRNGVATYQGSPFPTREFSFNTNLTLFNNITVTALLDHRGGYKLFNSTEEFRCGGSFAICEGLYNPDASLEQQAQAVSAAFYGLHAGFIEDADFWKLREMSVRFGLPDRIAERFGTQGMALTLAGRNLATWTDYTGLDPEINYAGSGSNFNTADFLTQPPVRSFTARIDVNF